MTIKPTSGAFKEAPERRVQQQKLSRLHLTNETPSKRAKSLPVTKRYARSKK
jgi:hypothetical protein